MNHLSISLPFSSHIAVLLRDGSLSLFSVEQPDKPETTVAVAEEVLNLSAASASGKCMVLSVGVC